MPVPYSSMLHIPPTNCHLLTDEQENESHTKKAYLSTKKTKRIRKGGKKGHGQVREIKRQQPSITD